MSPEVVPLAYDANDIKPGWVALVLVLLLALATFLLWRSMNTQLGKIRAPHQADVTDDARPGPTTSRTTDGTPPDDHQPDPPPVGDARDEGPEQQR